MSSIAAGIWSVSYTHLDVYKRQVYDLQVEAMTTPLAIDCDMPRFSWKLGSRERGTMQAAYEIQVFMEDTGELVWDSGLVEEDWYNIQLKKEGERERKVKSQEKTPPKRFRMKEVKPYLWSIVVKSGQVDLCSHPKHSAN